MIVTTARYRKWQVPFLENTKENEATGCIEWIAARHPQGYGLARRVIGEPSEPRAHRRAWIMAKGPIPSGLCVLHRCDNPCCVNVDHLFLGTDADNSKDKYSKRRNLNLAGAEHGRSRFFPEDVLRIREAHLFGARIADLSRAYGVSDTAVHKIIKRENWAHLG